MWIEEYKGIDIYQYFISGEKGFSDSLVYTSEASRYGRNSIEKVKSDIDKIWG